MNKFVLTAASIFIALNGCAKHEGEGQGKAENAQPAPPVNMPLPDISPDSPIASTDTIDYLCKVNTLDYGRLYEGNFWTHIFKSGGKFSENPSAAPKFQTISINEVRVVSSSPELAAKEIESIYQQKYTNRKALDPKTAVDKCEEDPRSTRGIALENIALSEYRNLKQDTDFAITVLALAKDLPDNEGIVNLFGSSVGLAQDAFARHAQIEEKSKVIKDKIAALAADKNLKNIVIDNAPYRFEHYSFEKKRFEIKNPMRNAAGYLYVDSNLSPIKPTFYLSGSDLYSSYVPKDDAEAKYIENALNKNQLKARTYIQLTKSIIKGQTVTELVGKVAAIEFIDEHEKVVFQINGG